MIAASALLAALLIMTAKALTAVTRQSLALDRRAAAMLALENAMEQLAARPWSDIDRTAVEALEAPRWLAQSCPHATLTGEVATLDEPLTAKRVTLQLALDDRSPMRPLTLTTWVYRRRTP